MQDSHSSQTPRTWSKREIIVTILTGLVVAGLVFQGWFGHSQEVRVQNSSALKDEFELKYFDVESKMLVGLVSDGSEVTSSSTAIATSAITRVISTSPPDTFAAESKAKYFARQAVLSDLVNRASILTDRTADLRTLGDGQYKDVADELEQALTSDGASLLSPRLSELLGWMSDLATVKRAQALQNVSHLAKGLTFAGSAIAIIGLTGLTTLLVLVYLRVSGKMRFRFFEGTLARSMRIEIFCIYMLIMVGAGYAMSYVVGLNLGVDQLTANLILMSAIPLLLIMYSRIQGHSLRSIIDTLGLNPGSGRKLASDVVIAPLFYFATWTVLLPVLIVYALIIKLMGVDMSQGAHPVFSWILKDPDPFIFTKVFILAVVIAPVLEEITFRGALYSWLRARLNAPIAILTTAFIFAIIHPQGPIGVVPLMGCAIAFGILREWRGSLYAPMLAHACFNGGTLILFWLATSV